jgi:hypothetical protein
VQTLEAMPGWLTKVASTPVAPVAARVKRRREAPFALSEATGWAGVLAFPFCWSWFVTSISSIVDGSGVTAACGRASSYGASFLACFYARTVPDFEGRLLLLLNQRLAASKCQLCC